MMSSFSTYRNIVLLLLGIVGLLLLLISDHVLLMLECHLLLLHLHLLGLRHLLFPLLHYSHLLCELVIWDVCLTRWCMDNNLSETYWLLELHSSSHHLLLPHHLLLYINLSLLLLKYHLLMAVTITTKLLSLNRCIHLNLSLLPSLVLIRIRHHLLLISLMFNNFLIELESFYFICISSFFS